MWNKNTSKRHCQKQHRVRRLYKSCLLRFLPEVFWGECFWSSLQHCPLVSFGAEGGVGASKLLPSICTVRFLILTFSYFCKAGHCKYYNGPPVVLKGVEERSRACSPMSLTHTVTPSAWSNEFPHWECQWSDSQHYNLSCSVSGQNHMDILTGPSTT